MRFGTARAVAVSDVAVMYPRGIHHYQITWRVRNPKVSRSTPWLGWLPFIIWNFLGNFSDSTWTNFSIMAEV